MAVEKMHRSIVHIDMDAFYASVEQRDNPEYAGKPVIVGADPMRGKGRGVVSAASYEARKFGIHSAQPISQAFRKCPHGIFVPVNGNKYQCVSDRIIEIFQMYTPLVEAISLDEAFLDLSGTRRLKGDVYQVAKEIKNRIREIEKLTASVGIGPNKLIAKIASDLKKPDGFVCVKEDEVKEFLSPLPVEKLWGVGRKLESELSELGIHTVGDLAVWPLQTLKQNFGATGIMLWNMAHGIDESPVVSFRDTKSISNEITFSKDIDDHELLQNAILQLSEKVGYRSRRQNLQGRTVFIKVRLADFTTFIRHYTTDQPVSICEDIYKESIHLFNTLDFRGQTIRLVGVGLTCIVSGEGEQLLLFHDDDKRKKVTRAVDKLKQKYGESVIRRGL